MSIINLCRVCLPLLFAATSVSMAQNNPEHTLKRSDWPTVVEGRYLIAIPSLRSVLQEFEYNSSDLRIEIRYPGGDAGNVWALEVHSWLIAMGLASTDIVLEPGSGDPQALKLQAVRRID